MERMAKRMQDNVFAIVRDERKKMDATRMREQQAIDTLEEYERVAALCPNFETPKTAVRAAHHEKRGGYAPRSVNKGYRERIVIDPYNRNN